MTSEIIHDSDCALHNAAASQAAPCDCDNIVRVIVGRLERAMQREEKRAIYLTRRDTRFLLKYLAGIGMGSGAPAASEYDRGDAA